MTKQTRKKAKNRTKAVTRKPTPSKKKSVTKAAARKPAARRVRTGKPAALQPNVSEIKKSNSYNELEEQPRLLRETKTTTAALNLLEKAIKLIYQKELRKARAELRMLVDGYPAEQEILARARTYLQICDREEAAHKRPVIANDQLYALGVMEHNRGDYDRAIQYFRQHLDKNPSSDHIYYSLAASFAVKGDTAEAVRHLQKAVELNEENRIFAKNDSDFSSLHGRKEFSDLVGWWPPAGGG